MTTFIAHYNHPELASAEVPTDAVNSLEVIRDLALTARQNQVPFRISYPQRAGHFRMGLPYSFTSR